ncbi:MULTISPECIES: isochorismatase family protein [Pseudomonas]|uniref:Isochorismatase family protein n=3 Tax=Pseudomonas TaxID=286 RepID=A0AAP9N3X2_PSEPU|nr:MULTISPECIES: isochorismatase family protein [Pseudomonas]4L07_A Chain A, Hydrolase, isochorismatase family [Pseudomonas putida S16]4L07_B Chain B, Hydrolase, isochorismatase family [Pseudomonas putida S16]ADN26552.1 maleamate amidase [Pseudomonas putida S16]AEJ14598.1 hydrolase, isochorismatase family [Pseudomonas putida S16]MDD2036085.1 isochorismatase family protein [Pseudomonas putida]MDD2041100.1 isochorismatase family protein [Pseudomonas putida]MDH1933245.1 isochorismatase family p
MSQKEVYDAAGFGNPVSRGVHPAIIVVDFSYGFTDLQYPTASDASLQMSRTKEICDLARALEFPVIFTTIAYHPGEIPMLPWLEKSSGMAALLYGSRLVEIDMATGIQPNDVVVVKKGASSFFGSTLSSLLAGTNTDTVVVTGATTSGCVRATVVDAVQSGFKVLVPADCCADRAKGPHEASLYDIQQKYGDVTDSDDILKWLRSVAG